MVHMTDYQGARFYKCDLQMQTPADADHWMGREGLDVASDPKTAAETYIRRCYEEKLEVIAITDHNFSSKGFIPHLQQASRALAKQFGYEIAVFPGFEFTANVGKGVHVLAIFDQNDDLNELDHMLTECGVPAKRQKTSGGHAPSSKSLAEILNTVQKLSDGKTRGLVVLPHILSNDGIFDNEKIAGWMQQEEYINPQLLAVEIPKSVSKMSPGFQRLFRNGTDCNPDWKRTRQIATIMSSDTKAIAKQDGIQNYIGCRYTWIKMSKPSLEGLRQAFLDPESRIRISDDQPENPDSKYTHPRIKSISIHGAKFLANQSVEFSPNLNTFIGGRGTGKSTFFEYLRLAMSRADEVPESLREDFRVLTQTITGSARIRVEYDKGFGFEGKTWKLEFSDGTSSLADDEDVGRFEDFFPAHFYSRGQIEDISKSANRQRDIVDGFIRKDLDELLRQENDLQENIRQLNQKIQRLPELQETQKKLVASIKSAEAKIAKLEELSEPIKDWSKWAREQTFLNSLHEKAKSYRVSLEEQLTPQSLPQLPDGITNTGLLTAEAEGVKASLELLQSDIHQALKSFDQNLSKSEETPEYGAWKKSLEAAQSSYNEAIKTLEGQGINPQDYQDLVSNLTRDKANLHNVRVQIAALDRDKEALDKLINENLHPLWEQQAQLRQTAASRLNARVPQTEIATPTVKIEIAPFQDAAAFREIMAVHHQDRRVISEADWDEIVQAIFESSIEKEIHPAEIITEWAISVAHGEGLPSGWPTSVAHKKLEKFLDWIPETSLNELRSTRIPDAVTVTLHRREDGKAVGDLAGRTLSAGQRATTILSLLLADGSDPILIDQPEDDLDNEFVYQQLVPLIRNCKHTRQLIMVTHNANIPVNGDAELIIPLEVRNSAGNQKQINGVSTVGSLDTPTTQEAVEKILEGSAEAFRKRREKYGF